MVTLTPSKELVFNLDDIQRGKTNVSVSLTIDNPSPRDRVLFKIKTTKPHDYHVKPNSGIIPAGGSVLVNVSLLTDADNLAGLEKAKEDKFLVQTIAESECDVPIPEVIPADKEAEIIKDRWTSAEQVATARRGPGGAGGGPNIVKNKLTCKVIKNGNEPSVAAATSAAAAAAPSAFTKPTAGAATNPSAAQPDAAQAKPQTTRTVSGSSDGVASNATAKAAHVAAAPVAAAKPAPTAAPVAAAAKPKPASSAVATTGGETKPESVPSIILLFAVFLLGVIMGKFVI